LQAPLYQDFLRNFGNLNESQFALFWSWQHNLRVMDKYHSDIIRNKTWSSNEGVYGHVDKKKQEPGLL